eukprot:4388053-Prymnesium_polylepis.1
MKCDERPGAVPLGLCPANGSELHGGGARRRVLLVRLSIGHLVGAYAFLERELCERLRAPVHQACSCVAISRASEGLACCSLFSSV